MLPPAAVGVQPYPRTQQPQTPRKRATYITLSKRTMPVLVKLFLRFKANMDVYIDRTLKWVLSVRIIPHYYHADRELTFIMFRLIQYL